MEATDVRSCILSTESGIDYQEAEKIIVSYPVCQKGRRMPNSMVLWPGCISVPRYHECKEDLKGFLLERVLFQKQKFPWNQSLQENDIHNALARILGFCRRKMDLCHWQTQSSSMAQKLWILLALLHCTITSGKSGAATA